jgi:LuxR family transcriptional regulator, maltose regulon positive regulatory protein
LILFLQNMRSDANLEPLLSPLLQDITCFEQRQLPAARRWLRRKSQVVPFAPPKLTIFALGKMQVKVADNPVKNAEWRTSAARDLLYILLSNPNGFTREQIDKILWPNSAFEEVNLRFKNMVYQLRQTIGKNAILLENEIYLFNRAIDYDYDVENFKKEIALAQKAADPVEKMAHYQAVVRLYKGTYLPHIDATWFIGERNALHRDFITAALSLGEFFLLKGNDEKALSYGERVLKEDRSQEDAHRLVMRTHAAMGNQILVTMQYNQCCKMLKEDLNTDPTDQTQKLYYELTH